MKHSSSKLLRLIVLRICAYVDLVCAQNSDFLNAFASQTFRYLPLSNGFIARVVSIQA